ncbi:MAG: TnsD family transposase [Firmicutes bacterium]|nr:TnsD family transposase [Bacillota bacterium]
MITFFPTPYPDEVLYSVFARYHAKSPNINGSETARDLFSVNRIVCTLEFPSLLEQLVRNMPMNNPYDVDFLIDNHTLFPYYTVFMNEKDKDHIKRYMALRRGEIYYKIAGILNPMGENRYLRFCQKCNEEAMEKYGEIYWHRKHQIRGIYICPTHGTPIYNSSVSLQDNKYRYIAATKENCLITETKKYEDSLYNQLLIIAKDMAWILNNPVINTEVKEQYRNQLKILKYATANGALRQKDLIEDFETFWGIEILEKTHSTITKTNNCNWLLEMGWNRKTITDTLKNILFLRFLGLTPNKLFNREIDFLPFGKGKYPCLNPVCPKYKEEIIESIKVKENYKTKSPIGYFTCPVCGFSYLRRGPDNDEEDRLRYSRIIDYGGYWMDKLIKLSKDHNGAEIARIMGTTHTTVYDYLRKIGNK